MSGLFGGGNDAPAATPITTLPAPTAASPEAQKNQSAAQADALKRAQTATTLASDGAASGQDAGTYNRTTLG